MEARRRTWFDERGLVVAGRTGERALPFYAGALHYWRVPKSRWPAMLAQIHATGLTLVETPVPWRVHEPKHAHFDWEGARDLPRFVELARAAGLGVVLRPGPNVNAELTSFGFPDHVLADEHCLARTSRGTHAWMPSPPRAWPLPSYASTAFRERVRAWYAAVAEVLVDLLAPEGPVVALGVDSGAQMFFRLGAYDHDYHPDALAWWHESARACGLGDAVEPPRAWDPAAAARCAAWVRFKDEYMARALGDFAAMLDDVGLAGIARFHDAAPGHHGLTDARRIQQAIAGPVGTAQALPRAQFRASRQRGTALVGDATPIPLALGGGVGASPWFPPLQARGVVDPDRERDSVLTMLAAGVRGFDLARLVERDRAYGAAITEQGTLEPHAKWIALLVRTLGEVTWPTLRRPAAIALVHTRADARFGLASNLLDPVTPSLVELLDLGPGGAAELGTDAGAVLARKWHDAVTAALDLAQVPYAIVDESASEDELAGYRAVVVPTGHRIDRALWQRLRALADAKRAVVVIGPGTPSRDELDRPLDDAAPRRLGRLRAGSLDDVRGLAEDLAGLAGDPADAWIVERPDTVRVAAYLDPAGKPRVVFATSDADKAATAVVLASEGTRALRDAFTNERHEIAAGTVTIALPPRGVRMFVVE